VLLALPVFLALPVAGGGCDWDDGNGGANGNGNGNGNGNNGNQSNGNQEPVTLDPSDFTYVLEESPGDLTLWTTPATHRVVENERPPEATRSGLRLSGARREFEPVQLVMGPTGGAGTAPGSVTVSVDLFPELGSGQRVELARVGFEQGWAETLEPLQDGAEVALSDVRPQPIWITVYVPPGAPAGEHETTLTVTPAGGAPVSVPLRLYVFDFSLPEAVGFATQLNVGVGGLVPEGGTVDDAKAILLEHRFTPKSVTWPSGFHWDITWDNSASSDPCEVLWDEPDEGDQYSIGALAPRYMLGEGWRGEGFSNAMIFQFVDNSTPRPATLCGIDRGDHYGTSAYNAEWAQYLGALESYLSDHGLRDKAYYYVQNEPQDEADHRLAAHLCRLTRQAAPGLRIAISEEPKPEIAEDSDGACGYDIWIAHVRAYQQDYAWQRQDQHGEQVWLYSLDHDPDPYFNPTRLDAQGMHQRIIPWVSWRLRATGWAYYDFGRFFDGARPTVRAELFREGFEDYEYLLLANDGPPRVYATEPADATVGSVASSLTSWTRDPDALMVLRHELGRYIEGSRATLPVLEVEGTGHPRDAYYLNFQDPAGSPAAEPLEAEGHTWQKVGWSAWADAAQLGWYGEHIGDSGIARYGYDDIAGYSEVQRSYLYDDYGRDALFEFGLENGRYEVTVGVGRPAHGYASDPHNVAIEGQPVVDELVTTDAEPTAEATALVDLTDGRLSMEIGGRSDLTGEWAYTFVAYLKIEPVP